MAPLVDLDVQVGGAAEHLSTGDEDATAGGAALRLALEGPVERAAEELSEPRGDGDEPARGGTARLDQEDAQPAGGGEALGEHAARGTGAEDDHVVHRRGGIAPTSTSTTKHNANTRTFPERPLKPLSDPLRTLPRRSRPKCRADKGLVKQRSTATTRPPYGPWPGRADRNETPGAARGTAEAVRGTQDYGPCSARPLGGTVKRWPEPGQPCRVARRRS
jgi:hypothetical protein